MCFRHLIQNPGWGDSNAGLLGCDVSRLWLFIAGCTATPLSNSTRRNSGCAGNWAQPFVASETNETGAVLHATMNSSSFKTRKSQDNISLQLKSFHVSVAQ